MGLSRFRVITPIKYKEEKSMKEKILKCCTKEIGLKIVIAVFFIALFGTVIFLINDFEKEPLTSNEGQSYEKAKVVEVTEDNIQEDGNRYGNQKVTLELKSGDYKGEKVSATSPSGTLFGADCVPGMKVIAIVSAAEETLVVTVFSQDRTIPIIVFVLIFVLSICLIGGKKGVKSVISLAFTLICIFFILFPLLYKGMSPFVVTVIISAVVTIFTILFVGGINNKSFAAIFGTVSGVVIAGISAYAFGKAAGISGYNVSDIENLNYVAQYCKLQIGGLLFAGIIISALGAVMDVGMSISSTINEIYEKKPDATVRELFMSGIHVGKDMMGTMSNTLILAFVGGSITTLMLNYSYNLPANQLMNSYNIGIEIMQGISGSLGIVLTVPVTALAAASWCHKKKIKKYE